MITTIAPGAPASLPFFTPRLRVGARRVCEDDFEVGRQRRLGADQAVTIDGRHLDAPRVKEQPIQAGRPAPRDAGGIHRVAGDRVADRRQVHAQLVGAPGDEVQLEQRPVAEVLLHAIDGRCRPAIWHDGHARAVARVAADGCLDPPDLGRRQAVDEREVRLLDATILELAHQRLLRPVVARDQDQAAGVAVEAVDDARPVDAADGAVRLGPAPGQQRVDERAAGVAGRRVRDQAGRLVHDQHVVVLVDDVERDVVGLGIERLRRRHVEHHLRARLEQGVALDRPAGDGQPALLDQPLHERARQPRRVGHDAVGASGAGGGRHDQRHRSRCRSLGCAGTTAVPRRRRSHRPPCRPCRPRPAGRRRWPGR